MSVNYISLYTKNGATFANGEEARLDKNSLFGPTLTESYETCYNNMIADGILLEFPTPVWDQATYSLKIVKPVTSAAAYEAAVTFDKDAVGQQSQAAGWTFVSNYVE